MPRAKTPGAKSARRQHSDEVLQQVVHEHHVLGKSLRGVSRDLDIPESTVRRTVKCWEETGKVKRERLSKSGRPSILNDEACDYIKAMIELDQDVTLRIISERLETSFGLKPTLSTISRALAKLGYSKLVQLDDSRSSNSGSENSISGQSTESSIVDHFHL